MKKYVKPELFYERYELSQHIAACAWDLNLTSTATCGTYKGDPNFGLDASWILFTVNAGCTDLEGMCYQNALVTYGTFNS